MRKEGAPDLLSRVGTSSQHPNLGEWISIELSTISKNALKVREREVRPRR